MNRTSGITQFDWHCKHSWKKSAKNTAWCVLGCAIGDNVTILLFQWFAPHTAMLVIMLIAMLMGLLSSITLETIILIRQMSFTEAVKTAFGMSFISMLMMESAANVTSILLASGNRLMLTWWSLIPSWAIGYLCAWIYNYYKLKKYGKACHS